MAAGDLRGAIFTALGSITATSVAGGSVAVSVDDLIFVTFGEQTSLTVTGLNDNLGTGTYTATNAGTDAGNITGRSFYKRVLNAANLTVVNITATPSSDDFGIVVAVFQGPFHPAPLDANPTNTTVGTSNPIQCPPTGTTAQAQELIVAWLCVNTQANYTSISPLNIAAIATLGGGNALAAVGYNTVTAINTYQSSFTTSSAPAQIVKGANSFRLLTQGAATLTLDALTLAANGTAISPRVGTAALTLDALTLSASGGMKIQGIAALTLGALGLAASGGQKIQGTLNSTLGALGLAASGATRIQGTFANTLGALTLTATGVVQARGTAALTLADLTLAASGGTRIQGTLNSALDALTLAATGTTSSGAATGTAALVLDALALTASGGVAGPTGTLAVTLADATLVAQGYASVQGTFASTLANATLSAAGNVAIQGTLGATLGALQLAASNTTAAKHRYIFDVGGTDVRNIFESEYDVSYLLAPVTHATDFR
jgi:hypothetical protein